MDQAQRRAFLEARRSGIGGSDLGALVGVHPFGKTAVDVFNDKVRPLPEELPEPTGPQARGIYLEPIIGQTYAEEFRVTLVPGRKVTLQDRPYIMANPDFLFIDNGQNAALEAKAPGLEMFAKLKQDGITAQYQLQAQQYMLVIPIAFVAFRFLNAERWAKIDVNLQRDEKLGRDITAIQDQFWNDHVLKGIAPANDQYHIDVPEVEGGKVVEIIDAERIEAIDTMRQAAELFKNAELLKKTSTETMKLLLGATGVYEAPGDDPGKVHRLHYTQVDGKWTFDEDALFADGALNPTMVQQILIDAYADEPNTSLRYILDKLKAARIDFNTAYRKRGASYTQLRTYYNTKRK